MRKYNILLLLVFASFQIQAQTVMRSVEDRIVEFQPLQSSELSLKSQFTYMFLSFDRKLTSEDHKILKTQGTLLLDYFKDGVYSVAIPNNAKVEDLRRAGAGAFADIPMEMKVHTDIVNQSLPDYAIIGNDAILLLEYIATYSPQAVEQILLENDVIVIHNNYYNNVLQVKCALKDVLHIATLPQVKFVEPVGPPAVKDDRRGRNLHRVNRLNGIGGAARNYTGEGVNVLVRDDGRVFEHIDFKGRNDQSASGPSRGSHGDGVAGILCGAGNLDPYFTGMAPKAFMYVNDYAANFLDETLDLHLDDDVLVTNSSYSDGCNGGYTLRSTTVDQQMFDNPTLLHVFSAGNSGTLDCDYGAGNVWGNITGGHKIGKNVIATANLNYEGELENSSSRGPAADGRIKPDISANGFGHESTAQNQGYMTFGGTSAAAPVVAGVAAVLQEAHQTLKGERANAALIKALMLNTANDLGNKGPDFKFGWGSLNAHSAVKALEEERYIEREIGQSQIFETAITVPAGTREVRVMTYWVDRQGRSAVDLHLINDLDTRLTKDGETFMPWLLDHTPVPALLDMPAIKGEDHRNNMEQIAIDDPEAGEYTLTIFGEDVPFDDARYIITWEFETDEVELTYPVGGENLEADENAVIHWDAYGDSEQFQLDVLNENNDVILSRLVVGDKRLAEVRMPDTFFNEVRVRISRGGSVSESEPVILSTYADNLVIDNTTEVSLLAWDTVPGAVSYNLYRLGDLFMELDQVVGDTFEVPNDPFYRDSWLAVSPVFENGMEGKRSRAIPGKFIGARIAPNDIVACANQTYTFATLNPDPNTEYDWEFGTGAQPATANTVGPHEVTYITAGAKVVKLTIQNVGGTNGTARGVIVEPEPTGDKISVTEEEFLTYTFTNNTTRIDTFTWDMGDGTELEGSEVTHTYDAEGIYQVQLRAAGSCGEIILTEIVEAVMVATDDIVVDDFKISPNPNDGLFTVEIPDLEGHDVEVSLISIDGRVLRTQRIKGGQSSVLMDYKAMPKGMYHLAFTFDQRMLNTKIAITK